MYRSLECLEIIVAEHKSVSACVSQNHQFSFSVNWSQVSQAQYVRIIIILRDRMENTAAALKCTEWPISLEICRQRIIVVAFIKANIHYKMTNTRLGIWTINSRVCRATFTSYLGPADL